MVVEVETSRQQSLLPPKKKFDLIQIANGLKYGKIVSDMKAEVISFIPLCGRKLCIHHGLMFSEKVDKSTVRRWVTRFSSGDSDMMV